ncbi:MAG: tetratricopeptide repeat protein [Microcystis panniformis Mp_MB_F_20051200_S9]|uniref:Tetratricopeptide repeat protein n=1 Tax=Microcystis panniformis Mp_MB_F_20051200_S9 TaxID=2486223 RepID=A0A552Q2A3_9CHRO|nr:MAG: tetratricopeptide repeat protein [Microcystis panniformis Mp_MB_F_20080800_S26D]TRV48969.1 MAG: tetratricopeptide repeat protein [Microcystis panniformis Mp_GB_SS_20050300_S99D]TRV54381.1 MAG: tetratricopeptide repeat protein [Microcystis panniformis Mp_GB_SS_20050300_S99]TRV54526.1 MAG: tetratricopeptide repeat protein [Microcystis panniformis Mp_MB_F_20080800_S26]TRV63353.1 MAG: tetratricopeptide repeat protein [Microcystis panniformis Mp_MB_F_20051200_S9]TRV69546.1 MAG: tetratricope
MLKPFPLLLSLLLLSVAPVKAISPFSHPAIVTENTANADIERSIRQVTVRITSETNRGSGTIIGKNGANYLVITNAHVIRGVTTLQIQTHDGQTRTGRVVPNSLLKDKDLALVEFRDTSNYAIARISSIPLDTDIEITMAGYSGETGQYTTDEGKIEQMSDRPLREGYSIGYSGDIVQGMSGGGIFFEDELIGINGRSAYPILSNYIYEDGTKPTDAQIQQMRTVNWGISLHTLLTYIQPEILTAYKLPLPKNDSSIENPVYTGYIAQLEGKARAFTVQIESSSEANGSGVIIAREGNTYTVLTADHVLCEKVAEEKTCADFTYTLVTSDGKTLPLDKKTIIRQEGVDLAIFTFESSENYPIAEIANYSPDRESPVFVAGFPKIGDKQAGWLFSGGAVKSQEEGLLATRQSDFTITQSGASRGASSLSGGYDMVYTSITFGGMSGGPVLNAAGQVIGIHGRSEGVKGKIQLGFSLGIPINSFVGLQAKFRVKLPSLVTVQPQLTAQQKEEIDRTLVNVEVPETNASADIWIERGNQLWRLKKEDRALQAFDRAIQLNNPEYTYLAWYGKALIFRRKYQYREALEAIEKALATLPVREQGSEFHAEIFNYSGIIYSGLNQFPKAIDSFEQAIKISTRNPNYYNNLSGVLQDVKQYDRALEAINRAIEIAPRSAWYSNRGNIYKDQKKWDLALADYNKALTLNPNNPRTYMARADVYEERKEWDLALADYNRAIEIDANFAAAYRSRGVFYQTRKQWDLALADFNKAITIDPNDPNSYGMRGIFYIFQSEEELAIADLTKEIEINPYSVVAHSMRGVAYESMEKSDLALADFNKAIELDPNSGLGYESRGRFYTTRREWDLALADFNKALELDPNSVPGYEGRGNLYSKQEKWDLALADLNKAIELGHFSSYVIRGGVYFQQQKLDLALADFNKAIELSPNPEFAYGARAILYRDRKELALALTDLNRAIQINPYFELAYSNRGDIYRDQNQLDLALADYNKAIELNGNDAELYYNRGEIYRQQQKSDIALADYSRAIELDPKYWSAYLQRFLIYDQQKKWDLAIADITKVIEIKQIPQAYFSRGYLYYQTQKWDLALADFNRAIELKPDNASFYFTRGYLYYQTQKWDLALADFNQAIKLKPENASFYSTRGLLYYQTQKWDLALADFNQAIALDPKLKDSYSFRGDIYKRQKLYPQALQDYQKVLELDEKDLIAITNIGLIYYEQGDLNLTSSQFQKSLEINPQSAENQLALAVTLYRQGNTEKAIKLAQSALKIDPEFSQVETLQKNLWGDKIIADARKLLSQL